MMRLNFDCFWENKMINNNYRQFAIDDFYTQRSIEQYTDMLANQTSYCLHFHNAYALAERCQVNQLNNLKCKYCKAFYFPPTINKKNNDPIQLKKQSLKKMIEVNEQEKNYACELCGSINDISKTDNFINTFPQFHELTTKEKDFHYNSHFQSVIVSQTKVNNETVAKGKVLTKAQNQIIFVFCIDLDTLSQIIQLNNLTYFKTVVIEFFGRHIQNTSDQNHLKHQQGYQDKFIRQNHTYRILLTFSMNNQFFVADLNTISTICVDNLLKQRVFSSVPSENTQQIVQKENQRKESLIELLNKSSIKVDTQESIQRFQEYMDMLIEQRDQSDNKMRLSINGSTNFTQMMQLLSCDKSPCHSYIVSWISSTPVLNYEPHRVKKSNIHSFVYLFCQKPTHNQNKEASTYLGRFQQSNVRNELLLVRDNNEVRFINVSQHEESYQFYYLLYQLFAIVDAPKMFRPKWVIKTDSKYPPVLTNDPSSFFIKTPAMLYFVVSSLIDKGGHSKFQVSVQFQDWKKDENVWIINWTKDSQKQSNELKGKSQKQIQVIPRMPQICNYIHILVKYMINSAIRGKTDLIQGKRQLMSLNTVTGHQFSVIIQSIINHGVFRANNIQIGTEYLSKLYQYLSQFKGIPFEVLRFLSCCQYNVRRAVQMMFPLVISSSDGVRGLVYWTSGYVVNDNYESQNEGFEAWCEDAVSVINQRYEGKYFTKRFQFNNKYHNHHQKPLSHEQFITSRYLTKAGFLQHYLQPQHCHNQKQDSLHQNNHRKNTQSKNPYLLIDRALETCIKVYFQNHSEQHSY